LSDLYMISISDDTEPSDYVVVAEHGPNGCQIKYAEMIASGILPQTEEASEACNKIVQDHVVKALANGAPISETKVLYGDKNTYGNTFLIRVSNKSDYTVITKSKGGTCEVVHTAQVAKG
jgi:hypothetical protein